MGIFLALLHHPVLNKHGEVSTTAVTNVDIHDVARSARTYGVERFFLVTPIELQQELIGRVIRHWTEGAGGRRNPARAEAIGLAEVVGALDEVIDRIEARTGTSPQVVVTGAQLRTNTTSFGAMRRRLAADDRPPLLLLLGTGHGLAPEVLRRADFRLPAIDGPMGPKGYNHLSVRAAAAILLDRLLGTFE